MQPMKYTVAVRELCEFTAKEGDLDLRFTPSPSAQEGIAGHAAVASRRASDYRKEISLSGEYRHLVVRGRADGYDPAQQQLEEIKTHRGDLDRMPGNHRALHWAQVKIYGHLLCEQLGLSGIRLALVYYNIGTQTETVIAEHHAADALKQYFEAQCERFLDWAGQELAHRAARDVALGALRFPYSAFRPGQRSLAEAVYKSASSGRCLMAQAPTGIGKTVGTIFPLLKACATQALDKVFFLAAKTSGRGVALDALNLIRDSAPALPLRVIELVARDKACEHPDKACHGESCPLAQGFYDRLPEARRAALADGMQKKGSLRAIALAHQVCPYYLAQDLVRWADVVVGDYNYYFDLGALLHGLTAANEWRVSVLVDEAHNMIERARRMYTAGLDESGFRAVRRSAPAALKKALDRVGRAWSALHKEQDAPYQVYPAVPDRLLRALQQLCAEIADHLAEHPAGIDAGLQQFHFDALHFLRVAELYDPAHSIFDIEKQARTGRSMLCIRNVVPASFLAPRFAATRSTVLFSATLSPWHFYSDMLGLPGDTAWTDVESPFVAEQLSVRVAHHISTRYRHRDESLSAIVELIARQYRERPGNYLAFFSSFDYLQKVTALFRERHPAIAMWEQSRQMDEQERERFLERFAPAGAGIGFAVLGGSFAEGVDLPGDRLIGAFIATLGLPQVNPVNEQMKERMSAAFGAGYDYAYLFPGMQKVVQAAGRVIRTEQDRGVVHLIDDRFGRPEVLRLLPAWWGLR